MEVGMMQYPPGDSRMIDKIVHQLKSQGIFDQFRKECIADVDTKPAYQNLHQRVEGSVSGFLANQVWRPDLNKNQLRDSLRKHIHESGFLDIGVERIVDQVVNPKILTVFMPQVEDVVYKFLGIEKPRKGKENQNVYVAPLTAENIARKEEKKLPTLTDLLPKELEPISPESDTLKEKEDNSDEDGEVEFPDEKEEEDSSPPFEPIEEVNSHLEDSSLDSHLSGISELTSHDSQHSHVSFMISNHANNNISSPTKLPALDLANNDSQLSKVSSCSRLSIVSLCEQDSRVSHNIEINDDSQHSKTSLPVSGYDTQMSVSMEFTNEENEIKDGGSLVARDTSCDESSVYTSKLQLSAQDSSHSTLDGITTSEKPKWQESVKEENRVDERSEKEVYSVYEKMCEETPVGKLIEECEHKNEIFEYESDENEDKRLVDKFESKPDVRNDNKADDKFGEKCEKRIDEKPDKPTYDKYERGADEKCDKKAEMQYEFKLEDIAVKKVDEKCERIPDEKHERTVEEESEKRQNENLEKKLDDKFERKVDEKSERTVEERLERKSVDKSERKVDDKLDDKTARRLDEKYEKKPDDKLERRLGEKPERKSDDKSERKLDDKHERKSDEKSERKYNEKSERILDEKYDRKCEEKSERKYDEKSERKLDEKYERKLDEKSERKCDEKFERKLDEKSERKLDEKYERKLDEKSERKLDDKCERKSGEKSERKHDEKYEWKLDERAERKSDDKFERKCSEKSERKCDEKSEKKSDEKLVRKSDERSVRKTDDKSEKRLVDKSEKKLDVKLEKKTDDKSDRKSDTRAEKKADDKHDKKQEKHREDREKAREKKDEKKRLSTESKDIKKNDSSGHLSEGDRKRSDKDKHKKERCDSRSRAEKSKNGKEKSEKDGGKEKIQHEEKTEKDIMKEKNKQEMKENKDEKRSDEKEKKVEKDSNKDKFKKEDGDVSRHEKDTKKSRSDEKRERDGKEKPKSEEKGRVKHDDKHKDRTKSESRDRSDKSSRHDDKLSKDGSRSSSKESKERMKQETKDKKDMSNKNDEKKNKNRTKLEEKTSKFAEKESMKKTDKKKEETVAAKSSHTDRKSRDSGKKSKENKGRSITDDHRIHRDKHSDDRRSTDRDSNGTAQDKSVGSTTSRTNGNDSQRTQSRRDKGGNSNNSSKSDSGGNSESSGASTQRIESSKNVEENIPSSSKSSSPPSSLPFKKRPLSIQSEDEQESSHSRNGKLSRGKIKKPKIAANIFEVKKIMMLRKSLAKKERKQQKELRKNMSTKEGVKEVRSGKKLMKPLVAKRRKLGDVEKSLRKEVDTSLSNKQMPKVGSEKENSPELKYFDSELIPTALSRADSDFLAYVKQLVESDNLSEISTSSDTGSEASDVDDIIRLPSSYLDDIVAAELGAKIVKTDKGTEIVLNLPEDKELPSKDLASLSSTMQDSLPMANKSSKMVDPFSVIASPGETVVFVNPCDSVLRHNIEERMDLKQVSVQSSSSDTSIDDIILNDGSVRRILRQRSSSVASTNSNKSTSDRIEEASNGLGTGRIPYSGSKLHRKRVFLRKRVKKETASIPEMKPPEVAVEKRGRRRSQKVNTCYSNKTFASYLEDEDLSHDAFSEERDNIILDDESPVVSPTEISENVPDIANTISPIFSAGNEICFTRTEIPATVTQADDDSSDRVIVSEPSGGGYYIIKDNNNIDKGSSEDERGCGDGAMLNQDLILPTLRDLMVESGFRREDDKSDILSSLMGVENSLGNSLVLTVDNVSSVKLTARDAHETREGVETRRPKLGRSRRVGLGRPLPKRSSEQAGDDDTGNRTPPSSNMADFVMPLSPESDVSASSGEARKPTLDSKVGDGHTDPSPSNSDVKAGQISNSRLGDTEVRRSLRSGGIGTPGGRAQRYSSDDLYKPRPLFSQGSRRVRGRVSPIGQEAVANCTGKRHSSDVTETLLPSSKRRR